MAAPAWVGALAVAAVAVWLAASLPVTSGWNGVLFGLLAASVVGSAATAVAAAGSALSGALAAVFAWPVASAVRFTVNVAPLFAFAAEVEPSLASALKLAPAFTTVGAFVVEAATAAAVTGVVPPVVPASALALLGAEALGAKPLGSRALGTKALGAAALELASPAAGASPCGLAPELAAPAVLAAGVAPFVEGTGALAGSVGPALESPVFAAVALDGCGVCCTAGDGLAGVFAAACGGLAGAAVLASSHAENGCDSLSWLLAVAWARWDAKSEAAAETSDAILGILGTGEPLQDDIRH